MKKLLILSTSLLLTHYSFAQNLEAKIPKDASAVVKVRGDLLMQMISVSAINESELGKAILKEVAKTTKNKNYKSVEDFGLRLGSNAYYFFKGTDSIGYHCVLANVADAAKIERLFSAKSNLRITRNGDTRSIIGASGKDQVVWNNEYILICNASLKKDFFYDRPTGEKYGIKRVAYGDYYKNDYDDYDAVGEAVAAVDTAAYEATEAYKDAVDAAVEAAQLAAEQANEDSTEETYPVEIPVDIAPPVAQDYSYESRYDEDAYNAAFKTQDSIETALVSKWASEFTQGTYYASNLSNSIATNLKFQSSQEKGSAATLYIEELGTLYQQVFGLLYYFGMAAQTTPVQYGSMVANLFLEKDQIRVNSSMEMSNNIFANYKDLYKHKLNKKFEKYYNDKKVVGFASYAFNTEAYLKAMPEWLNYTYGAYMPRYKEDLNVAAELLSVILDEKAIAKVIKGDALFLLNDIGPKTYTYTSYDYDDDYKRTEVQKTRTETLPDILFMMSTDDEPLIKRLLQYSIRKEAATEKNGIYTFAERSSRDYWKLHLYMKDGILFAGTSLRDIQDIANNNYTASITKEQKNLLYKSNSSFYFKPKNLVGKISTEEFVDIAQLQELNNLFGTTGEIYVKATGTKGNTATAEMVAKVPEGNQNSLTYFFSIVDKMVRFNNR